MLLADPKTTQAKSGQDEWTYPSKYATLTAACSACDFSKRFKQSAGITFFFFFPYGCLAFLSNSFPFHHGTWIILYGTASNF